MVDIFEYIIAAVINVIKALAIRLGLRRRDPNFNFVTISRNLPWCPWAWCVLVAVYMVYLIKRYLAQNYHIEVSISIKQKFNRAKLAAYDCRHGKIKILTAFNGIVFDITQRPEKCPAFMRGRAMAYAPGPAARFVIKKLEEIYPIVGIYSDYKPITEISKSVTKDFEMLINKINEDVDHCSSAEEKEDGESANMQMDEEPIYEIMGNGDGGQFVEEGSSCNALKNCVDEKVEIPAVSVIDKPGHQELYEEGISNKQLNFDTGDGSSHIKESKSEDDKEMRCMMCKKELDKDRPSTYQIIPKTD